jgi:hypothetical protein
VTRKPAAKIAPVMRKVVALPAANARLRNRRRGSIGSLTRCSQAAKASSRAAPPARQLMISALAHPAWSARTRAQTMATTPPVTSVTPSGSSRSWAPWLSGSSRIASGRAAAPIGTLIQKIQCQSIPWVTAPPMIGPSATASPASPP